MRATAQRATLATAVVSAGVTAAITFVPNLHFAYRSHTAQAALETTAGLLSLLAAYLVLERFRRRRGRTELLLTAALFGLAGSNLLFAALPQIEAGSQTRTAAWAALLGTTLGTGLFAAAALLPDRRLRPHGHEARTLALVTVGAYAAVAAIVLLLARHLPLPVERGVTPEDTTHPRLVGDPALLVFIGVGAVGMAAAAVGFSRTADRRGDELLAWLGVAAALGAMTRVNYFIYPSRYSDWFTTGDVLRLAFCGALFVGALREIASYQPGLARAAVLDERRRLARDLHDGLSQELAFIGAQARTLLDRRGDDDELVHLADAADRAIEESRLAIEALSRPADQPLPRALADVAHELAARSGSAVVLELADADADEQTRETLVRILREAITNAVRHAGPARIAVRLEGGRDLRLTVADDGAGFDPDAAGPGFGLVSMRERAEAVGGSLAVASRPGTGTTVEVVVPR